MKYSYSRIRRAIPADVSLDYRNIWEEYKKFVGSERMSGDMPKVEGAAAITYDAYYMLMEAAIKASPKGKGSAESSIVNFDVCAPSYCTPRAHHVHIELFFPTKEKAT